MTTNRAIACGLVFLTVAVFWPVTGFDYIPFDDVEYVRGNPPVRAGLTWETIRWAFTTFHGSFWIPLFWLSLMLDTTLFGTGAGGHHLVNLVLHVTSTLVLFHVLSRATRQPWPSAVVAALFAVHPLHVESVAWVTERKDTLSTCFLMFTVWSWVAYAEKPSTGGYVRTLALYACGLMAKPMLMTLGVVLLAVDRWPLGRFARWPSPRLVLEKVPFLLLAFFPAVAAMVTGGHVDTAAPLAGVPVVARVANAIEATVLYLVHMVWPVGLAVLYPEYPGTTGPPMWRSLVCVGVLVAVSAWALRDADRRPWVLTGWWWYLVMLVPVSGLVKIGHFSRADRFTYAPLVGVFIALVWTAWSAAVQRKRESIAGALAAVAVVAAAAVAHDYLGYWRDGVTLFARTVAVTGDNPVARYLLGVALQERSRADEAMAQFEEALRIWPSYAHAHTNVGTLLLVRDDAEGARRHFEWALRTDPAEPYAHTNLGNLLVREGKPGDALMHYEAALRHTPDLVEALAGRGRALASQGNTAGAVAAFQQALGITPGDARLWNELGSLVANAGDLAGAATAFTNATRADPQWAPAHNNLANVLAMAGRYDEAIPRWLDAIRLDPNDAGAHDNVGQVLALRGRRDEAVGHFREALRIDPANVAARAHLEQLGVQ